jgi:spermidine/putrescine transport system permease protein
MRWLRRNGLNVYAAIAIAYMLVPIVVIAVFSFGETPRDRLTFSLDSFTLEYWQHAFALEELNDALLTSMKLAALATVISTLIGTLMALGLVRYEFFGRRATNLLIVLPLATPEIVIGAALLSLFIYYTIPLGFTTLLIAHVMFSISFVVVPAVVAGAFLAFALSLDDFVISNFNSGTTVTFPLYVFGVALRGIPVQVNALATMIFIVTVAAILLVIWQQRRAERMAAVQAEAEPAPLAPAPGAAGG